MLKKNVLLKWLIVILSVIMVFHPMITMGQNLISADPADIFDSESIFINPAVISFQFRQVTLGMKVYQWGFLKSHDMGLHNSYFSLSLPEIFSGRLDIGITGQNFSVPLYDQTSFSFLVAKKFIPRLSLGIRYNLFTKSYHKKYFDLVDPDDPVFSQGTLKIAQSFGMGLLFYPYSTFAVGFSCDHINHPDISLYQDTFRQPLVYDFGIRYSYTYFSSSIYFNYLQRHWQLNWVFEARPSTSTIFKLGFVQQAANFSTQLQLFNGFAIDYNFDYPLYDINHLSKGSHQIGLVWDLDYKAPLKQFHFTDYDSGKVPIFDIPAQFFVDMTTETLLIFCHKVVRFIHDDVPKNALANLTEHELAINNSAFNTSDFTKQGSLAEPNFNNFLISAKYSKKYLHYLKQVAVNSKAIPVDSVDLITDSNSMSRAMTLRDSLVVQSPTLNQSIKFRHPVEEPVTKRIDPQAIDRVAYEQHISLNPDSVSFHISSLKMGKYSGKWKVIISDVSGHEVKSFGGQGNAPAEISWDWRDNEGNLISPDIYTYHIQWEGKGGQRTCSPPRTFSVKKRSRTLHIDVRSTPDPQNDQGNVIEIKLAN